jgi:hypothetical protein
MNKRESKWQVIFNKYLREERPYGFYELKLANNERLGLAQIEKHQYEALLAVETEGLVWKMSDADPREKPCDTLCIPPGPAYVVVKFDDGFYFIRIKEIENLKENGEIGMSKLTAKCIAEKILILE